MTSICTYLDELINPQITRLILYPADLRVETDVNWWSLGRGTEDTREDLDKIENRLRKLAATWTTPNRLMGSHRTRRALFYCWHDEQAGTLNVCLTSAASPRQNFGARIALLDSPRPLVQRLLNDPSPGCISMDELHDADDTEPPPEPARYIVPVWTVSGSW